MSISRVVTFTRRVKLYKRVNPKKTMLRNIVKFPIRIDKRRTPKVADGMILIEVNKGFSLGTMDLSKKLKIAPKNLIRRLKFLEETGLIIKDKVSNKPKGWKRVYRITDKGHAWLRMESEMSKVLEGL